MNNIEKLIDNFDIYSIPDYQKFIGILCDQNNSTEEKQNQIIQLINSIYDKTYGIEYDWQKYFFNKFLYQQFEEEI